MLLSLSSGLTVFFVHPSLTLFIWHYPPRHAPGELGELSKCGWHGGGDSKSFTIPLALGATHSAAPRGLQQTMIPSTSYHCIALPSQGLPGSPQGDQSPLPEGPPWWALPTVS